MVLSSGDTERVFYRCWVLEPLVGLHASPHTTPFTLGNVTVLNSVLNLEAEFLS